LKSPRLFLSLKLNSPRQNTQVWSKMKPTFPLKCKMLKCGLCCWIFIKTWPGLSRLI
jgi:hypothetical protein